MTNDFSDALDNFLETLEEADDNIMDAIEQAEEEVNDAFAVLEYEYERLKDFQQKMVDLRDYIANVSPFATVTIEFKAFETFIRGLTAQVSAASTYFEDASEA